jgi:hypothetical protein
MPARHFRPPMPRRQLLLISTISAADAVRVHDSASGLPPSRVSHTQERRVRACAARRVSLRCRCLCERDNSFADTPYADTSPTPLLNFR